MRRSSERCECGHARQRHHYHRRTKRWGACFARPLGVSGSRVTDPWFCECSDFRKAGS